MKLRYKPVRSAGPTVAQPPLSLSRVRFFGLISVVGLLIGGLVAVDWLFGKLFKNSTIKIPESRLASACTS